MNIRIAICDDELEICLQIENMISDISKKMSMEFESDIFTLGENLCKELSRTNYDLIFLDIELPKINGIEIGDYIRNILKNDIVQIAYVSSKTEYALQLFEYRPINFLVKPLNLEQLYKLFETFFKITGKQTQIFKYKKGRKFHKIELFKIKYFERSSRKVILHTTEGDSEFYDSLELIYESLKGQIFLFIHKSYLINFRYIKTMSYDHVVLSDDNELPISQSRRIQIRKMYMELEMN